MAVAITATDNENGTVTFTVTGSTGTVNIYTAPWSGGFINNAWTLSATRSGNGTVNATLTGLYWAHAVNGSDVSPIIGFRSSSGDDPTATQIVDAVIAKLQALDLTDIDDTSIVRRKIPIRLGLESGSLPAILVTLPSEQDGFGTNERDDVNYRVQLSIVDAGNGDNTTAADMEKHDLWRETIAKAFRNQALAGSPAYTVRVERGVIYAGSDFEKNLDSMGLTLNCLVRESRGII